MKRLLTLILALAVCLSLASYALASDEISESNDMDITPFIEFPLAFYVLQRDEAVDAYRPPEGTPPDEEELPAEAEELEAEEPEVEELTETNDFDEEIADPLAFLDAISIKNADVVRDITSIVSDIDVTAPGEYEVAYEAAVDYEAYEAGIGAKDVDEVLAAIGNENYTNAYDALKNGEAVSDGSYGDVVAAVQEALVALGADIQVDGGAGPATLGALNEAQERLAIEPTDKVTAVEFEELIPWVALYVERGFGEAEDEEANAAIVSTEPEELVAAEVKVPVTVVTEEEYAAATNKENTIEVADGVLAEYPEATIFTDTGTANDETQPDRTDNSEQQTQPTNPSVPTPQDGGNVAPESTPEASKPSGSTTPAPSTPMAPASQQTPAPETPSAPAEQAEATAAHTHTWVTQTVHHDDGYYESRQVGTTTVVDQAAWTETIYGYWVCNACGATFATQEEVGIHELEACFANYSKIPSQTIDHEAITHEEPVYEDVWVDTSWEETVTVCSECGATK